MTAAATTSCRQAKCGRPTVAASEPASANLPTKHQERAWLEALAAALDQAANTEEALIWSGESDRLLRVAHELADHLHIHPDEAGACGTIDNRAHTVAALIKAALQVPGDKPSAERVAFIKQTRAPLVALTGCATVLDGWETYPQDRAVAFGVDCEPHRDWLPDILAKVREATAVLSAVVDQGGTDPVWGLVRLADWTAEKVRARVDGVDHSETPCSDTACDIACLMSLLNLVAEQEDEMLLYASASILEVATSLCQSAQEAGHA